VVGEIKERYQGVTILALKRASDEELAAPPDESMVLASGDLVVAFGPRIGLEAMETITA
jgi:uncharacterized protein with PhoU and TrkA domain